MFCLWGNIGLTKCFAASMFFAGLKRVALSLAVPVLFIFVLTDFKRGKGIVLNRFELHCFEGVLLHLFFCRDVPAKTPYSKCFISRNSWMSLRFKAPSKTRLLGRRALGSLCYRRLGMLPYFCKKQKSSKHLKIGTYWNFFLLPTKKKVPHFLKVPYCGSAGTLPK